MKTWFRSLFSFFLTLIVLDGYGQALPPKLVDIRINEERVLSAEPNLPDDRFGVIKDWIHYNQQPIEFKSLLRNVWEQLTKDKKIKRLTKEVRVKLSIPENHCVLNNICTPLVAAYLPLSGYIVVDFDNLNEKTAKWFFHELVHAVQYTYRFPIDMSVLFGLTRNNTDLHFIRREDIVDYLRFFYEYQANWYTLRLGESPGFSKASRISIGSAVETGLKFVVAVATYSTATDKGLGYFNSLVPKVDTLVPGSYIKRIRYELNEPLALTGINTINPGVNVDFSFFRNLLDLVEGRYFGHLKFLSLSNFGDQLVYKDLNNNFYESSLSQTNCYYEQEKFGEDSPFVYWLTKAQDSRSCERYRKLEFWKDRSAILSLFETSILQHSYEGGTSGGGGPGLDILPFVQPQLLIDFEE